MRSVRVVLALATVLLAASSVMAEEKAKAKSERGPQFGRSFLIMERLRGALEQMDLTAEQKEKLEGIRKQHAPKLKEIMGKAHEILTADQRKAVGDAVKQARDAGKKGREVLQAAEAAAKLNPEQKEKLAKVDQEMITVVREAMKEVRGVLTAEQNDKLREKMGIGRKPGAKPEAK